MVYSNLAPPSLPQHISSLISSCRLAYPHMRFLIPLLSTYYCFLVFRLLFGPALGEQWKAGNNSRFQFFGQANFGARGDIAIPAAWTLALANLLVVITVALRWAGVQISGIGLLHRKEMVWAVYLLGPWISNFLIGMMHCNKLGFNSLYTSKYYPDTVCFQSALDIIFRLTCLIGAISIVCILVFCLHFSFHRRVSSNQVWLRRSMVPELVFMLTILLVGAVLELYGDELVNSTLIVLIMGLITVQIQMSGGYHITSPGMRKLTYIGILTGIWFAIGLLFTNVSRFPALESDNFLYIGGTWLLLLIAIYFRRDEPEVKLLYIGMSGANDPRIHISYLEELIIIGAAANKDGHYNILFHGFIAFHVRVCTDEKCLLSQESLMNDKNYSNGSDYSLVQYNFMEFVSSQYVKHIRQCPDSIELRISYIYFLLDILHSKGPALEAIYTVSLLAKTTRELFMIHQCKVAVESIGIDGKLHKGLDDIDENEEERKLNIEQAKSNSLLFTYMENLTADFIELWKHVQGENSEFQKLILILNSIHLNITYLEAIFKDKQHVFMSTPDTLKKYGTCLIFVLNQAEKGLELIETANILIRKRTKDSIMEHGTKDSYNLSHISEATAIVQIEDSTMRVVEHNLGFSTNLNLIREELLNHNLMDLIPSQLRSLYYNKIKDSEKSSLMHFKIYLNAMKRYIREFICYVKIKVFKKHGNKLFAIIKLEVEYFEIPLTNVLIDSSGFIIGYDQRFFELLLNCSNNSEPIGKNICAFSQRLKDVMVIIRSLNSNHKQSHQEGMLSNFPSFDVSIKFVATRVTLPEDKQQIYIIRFRKFVEFQDNDNLNNLTEFNTIKNHPREEEFVFSIIPPNFDIIGGFKKRSDKQIITFNFSKLIEQEANTAKDNAIELLTHNPQLVKNYAADIETMRLQSNGKLAQIFCNEIESDEEQDMKGAILEKEINRGAPISEIRKGSLKNSKNVLKSKIDKMPNNLNKGTKSKRSTNVNSTYNWTRLNRLLTMINQNQIVKTVVILVLLSVILASAYFFFRTSLMLESKNRLAIYSLINRKYCEMYSVLCQIHSPLVDILLYNEGSQVNELEKNTFEELMKNRLMLGLEDLSRVQLELDTVLKQSGDIEFNRNTTENISINCYFYPNISTPSTVAGCIYKLQSSLLNIYNTRMDDINLNNPDVYMVMMNAVNDIQNYLINAYYSWPSYIDKVFSDNLSLTTIKYMNYPLYLCSLGFLILINILLLSLVKKHEEVLEIYHGFGRTDVKILSDQCEYFYNYLVNGSDNSGSIGIEEIKFIGDKRADTEKNDEILLPSRGNRKGQLKRLLFIRILILALGAIFHHLFVYVSVGIISYLIDNRKSVISFAGELNAADLVFVSLQNKLKGAIYNYKGMYWNQNSTKTWTDFRNRGQPLAIKMFKTIFTEQDIHSEFTTMYHDVFDKNLCTYADMQILKASASNYSGFIQGYKKNCTELLGQVLNHGFSLAFLKLMDLLEKYLDDIEYYIYDKNSEWRGTTYCNLSAFNNKEFSLMRCITQEDDFRDLEVFYGSYMQFILNDLFNNIQVLIDAESSFITSISNILYLVYFLVFILLGIGIWIYSILKIEKKFNKEKMILAYAGIEFVERNRKFYDLLHNKG